MIKKLKDFIAEDKPEEVRAFINLLEKISDEDNYKLLLCEHSKIFPKSNEQKQLLELGYFSGTDLIQLIHIISNGAGVNVPVVNALLNQAIDWLLVSDHGLSFPNAIVRYRWNNQQVKLYKNLHIIDNIILGSTYITQKYRQSVPAIFVRKGDDQYTGTSFLTANWENPQKKIVVTAKHNVDPDGGVTFFEIKSLHGVSYTPQDLNWTLHPQLDVAYMPVTCSDTVTPIFLTSRASALTRTITLGYPRIATTDGPYLLAHSGELNAIVSSYDGSQHLIISNIVSPGNSGGPVLDEAGLCIGMVTNSFETRHEGGISTASAAVPSSAMLDFITPVLTK